VIIREPISHIAQRYENVKLISVCDRLNRIHELDWLNLSELKNLTHFSLHEHFRSKSMIKEYTETISEILQGLTEGIQNGMKLENVSLPVAQETFSSGHLENFIKTGEKVIKSIRLVGVLKPGKRSSTGQPIIEPIKNSKALAQISLIENIEKIELIEIPTIENGFIKQFTKCKRLITLSISWANGFKILSRKNTIFVTLY